MDAVKQIQSVADLYAHALAIEREAAARYEEFARFMEDHDNMLVADLFKRLARTEAEHAEVIASRARGHELASIESYEHSWMDSGAPESVAHEFVFRLMTPHDALKVALEAEKRAHAYFEKIFDSSTDPEIKALAASMMQDEEQHIAWVERALKLDPDPNIDWSKFFAHRRVTLPPGTDDEVHTAGGHVIVPKKAKKRSPAKAGKSAAATKAAKSAAPTRAAAPKKPAKKGVAKKSVAKKAAAKKPAAKKAAGKKPAAKRRALAKRK